MYVKVFIVLTLLLQARLARVWARHCPDRLKNLLESLQQLITLRVITGLGASRFSRDYCLQDEDTITAPTKLMKVREESHCTNTDGVHTIKHCR